MGAADTHSDPAEAGGGAGLHTLATVSPYPSEKSLVLTEPSIFTCFLAFINGNRAAHTVLKSVF